MPWIEPSSMLLWADAGGLVLETEHAARKVGFTLGPCAHWCRDKRIVDLVIQRAAWRLNPVLCRVEEAIGGFEYRAHGRTHRTLSTPREACGPEMRTLLYDTPDAITAVQLRLLPLDAEHWLKAQGRDPRDAHAFLRALVREGVAMRHVWTELSTAYVGFVGAMSQTLLHIATEVARSNGLEPAVTQAPRGPELAPAFFAQTKTWETLGPRDTVVLADPWAVLVMP
jgi:hypothetical protein